MQRSRQAFTLIELLVVMVIIGILIAILIPGVQAAREAARNNASKNNLRQNGLAWANYEAAKSHYAPSWLPTVPTGANVDGWSVFGQLLPYLEQQVIQSKIDYKVSYNNAIAINTADGTPTQVSAMRVPTFVSPAEPRDEVRFDGSPAVPKHYPINYAVNLGEWFVFDPATGQGGNGAAYPDSKLKAAHFTDGLSNTLCMSEVKGWQSYYRNAGLANPTFPATPADICTLGGEHKTNSGHTEWVDGRAHQIGFTTVFAPNTFVPCTVSGVTYDVDWNNWQEGRNLNAATPDLTPTYAAVTARSYFRGMVNVLLMDGSVRAIDDNINLGVWRAISTRNGQEALPDDFNK